MSIEFDYAKAKGQADRLEETARDLKKVADNSMETALQELQGSWRGENATQYLSKGRSLQEQVEETAAELEAIAESIRKVANALHAADMAAKSLAEKRNY